MTLTQRLQRFANKLYTKERAKFSCKIIFELFPHFKELEGEGDEYECKVSNKPCPGSVRITFKPIEGNMKYWNGNDYRPMFPPMDNFIRNSLTERQLQAKKKVNRYLALTRIEA